jgi:hypothetical protein
MALGVVMLLDVVATLGGGVVTTLGHGATTVGGVVCCSAMIAVSSWTARMCLILSAVDFWYSTPKYLEEVCCPCNGEVMLQGNWDLAVGWVQAPDVEEVEVACCRNVESEAPVVVGGRSYIDTIICIWHPGCS